MAQFSLSWDAHKQNICNGLSMLQQNGEFVDMTIAADGHHVKVHQMIMSLSSPYIKELITSAQCPHPIIFLNKTSYATLSAILEYIYTGEVMVEKENLSDLVEAAKELHIKGLEDMKLELATQHLSRTAGAKYNEGQLLKSDWFESSEPSFKIENTPEIRKSKRKRSLDTSYLSISPTNEEITYASSDTEAVDTEIKPPKTNITSNDTQIQYTVSNQGSLQIILNRFMYNLRYTFRKNGHRKWCCVEKRDRKCPATVVTGEDIVVQRYSAHNHPFHDKRILKKLRDNAVFSALHDAETNGQTKKQQKQSSVLKDNSMDIQITE